MRQTDFLQRLQAYSAQNVFNPYAQVCTVFDNEDADQIRMKNLSGVLTNCATTGVDAVWVGRDLGYRGGRRTGLAFTDDVNLATAEIVWNTALQNPTHGGLVKEQSAACIWNLINAIDVPVFTWNVFPFHPFVAGNEFSNRAHTAAERDQGLEYLIALIELLRPQRIIAIGNDAYQACCRIADSRQVIGVRHPSFGGQKKFTSQLGAFYGFHTEA